MCQQRLKSALLFPKKNLSDLLNIAKYIVQQYQGVFCVNFIAMEMMGCAAVHKDELWVDYQ